MRSFAVALGMVVLSSVLTAQAQAPAPTDRTKATHFSAADLKAALGKLPTDRPSSSVRVFTLEPYSVGVEQRLPRPQGASLHEAQAELFYVIEGSGTMLTGGAISDGKRTGTNVMGTKIDGGTRIDFAKGDFIMVPSGVPHQFVDLATTVHVMSMYLPNQQ